MGLDELLITTMIKMERMRWFITEARQISGMQRADMQDTTDEGLML